MAIEDRFIGSGWGFPPTFAGGVVGMTRGQRNVSESLGIIVTTNLGERVMRPNFGCTLEDDLFGPMNTTQLTMIETVLRRAILLHEPRVEARRVAVTADQGTSRLTIEVDYEIKGTKSRFSLVLPYDLKVLS